VRTFVFAGRASRIRAITSQPPAWVRWPYARIRRELETERGQVRRFVAQLEYDIEATPTGQNTPDWRTVARFDHESIVAGLVRTRAFLDSINPQQSVALVGLTTETKRTDP